MNKYSQSVDSQGLGRILSQSFLKNSNGGINYIYQIALRYFRSEPLSINGWLDFIF